MEWCSKPRFPNKKELTKRKSPSAPSKCSARFSGKNGSRALAFLAQVSLALINPRNAVYVDRRLPLVSEEGLDKLNLEANTHIPTVIFSIPRYVLALMQSYASNATDSAFQCVCLISC
jgi:hypothetical protein